MGRLRAESDVMNSSNDDNESLREMSSDGDVAITYKVLGRAWRE